jgi:hypothetical protein
MLFTALASACAADDSDSFPDTDDVEAPDDDAGKADTASELSVRAGDTTLWVTRALEKRGNAWILRGRTSRNLTSGYSFVFDDPFGEWTQKSPRVFEVSSDINSGRTVPDGVNLFSSLSFVHSSTRPDSLTARVVVRPRVSSTSGPSSLALTAELTPVLVAGHTVYRLKGRSTKTIASVAASTGTTSLVDANHFTVDLEFDQLQSLDALSVTAQLPAGPATRTATIGMSVKKLGLTTKDVEVAYPVPSCTSSLKSCLAALPDGALDTASCGEAIAVRSCQGQLGVVIDAAALAQAKTASDTALARLATDAVGLVGAARAAELTNAAKNVIAGRLEAEQGVWLLSATARAAVLANAAETPIDDAYAFPLSFVDGLPPAPGDAAQTRQVAADAVLGYLRTTDYEHSEFGRSYLALTKEYRAQHVASLKAFREESELMTFASMPNVEYYVGDWIGVHTEVTVDVTTGEPTGVLVELD